MTTQNSLGGFATGEARPSGDSVPLGARIRARNPSRIANNPYTNSRDLGSRSGTSTISGSATDSAARLEQAKTTGDQSGAVSYEEAKAALGW